MMDSQVIGVLFVVLASAAFSSAIRKFFSFTLTCSLEATLIVLACKTDVQNSLMSQL